MMTPCVVLPHLTTATTAPIKPNQQHDWTALPHSVLYAIFAHVHASPGSLSSLALACKQFATLARTFQLASVTLRSSSDANDVSRLEQFDRLLEANSCLAQNLEGLRLELGDGHRWIFSRILTPPFRTEDPASYDELRRKRADLDRLLSRILLRISGSSRSPTSSPYTWWLRVFELCHYTFYPISRDVEVMQGWQSVLGMSTLEVVRMSDVLDFPLALLGHAGEGVKEVEFLRVKLDRRDTEQAWSQERMDCMRCPTEEGQEKRLRPRVLSIRDCYPETIDPIIACAMNPRSFLEFSEVEELTVHPCLAVQAPSYNSLVNTVIAHSGVLDHLTWMSSAQHQVNDLDALCAADFTRFKKVDLVFDDGFSGFPQLLADIRDLLRAASNVFRTAPPSPDPENPTTKDHYAKSQFAVNEFLSVGPGHKSKRRVTSCLEELALRFDLENLAMQSRPEFTMSCLDPTVVMHYHEGDRKHDQQEHSVDTGSPESLYYSHIKYIWRLDELDMEVLKDIDGMLSGAASNESVGNATNHAFPHFTRLSTTCIFNPSSSYLLDDEKARDVYEACKEFVQRGLPRLHQGKILRFAFQKA